MRKMISKRINYIPTEWGVKDDGKIVAFVRFVAMNNDYSTYGDDADVYEEFDREGFTISKECSNYYEAYEWLSKNAEDSIRGR